MNWIGLCRVAMVDGLVEFHPSSSECYQPFVHRNGVFVNLWWYLVLTFYVPYSIVS